MRPVNLIPRDERKGGHRPTRTGPVAYLLVGGLVAVLAGLSAFVLTGNTVSEREAEVAHLEQEEQVARARAESLSAFADFAAMQQARTATVSSLATSRFDWERVLRELALVLPEDVWLVSLSGKVSPEVAVESEAAGGLEDGIAGPSLSMTGCAAGHESTAGFVAALEDIDGVTRVGLSTSERSGSDASSGTTTSESFAGCTTRDFLSSFQIAVAFDGVAPASGVVAQATTQQTEQVVTSTGGG
jgi:Tfp pilus assembly protein PilN